MKQAEEYGDCHGEVASVTLGGSDLSDEALAMNVQRARAKREAKDRAKRGLASTTGSKLFDSTRMFALNAVRYSDAEVEAQVRRTARQLTNAYGSRNSASGMSRSSSTGSRQLAFCRADSANDFRAKA